MLYIDQLGRKIELDKTPERIVSLVPSQTELLYYLGIKPVGQTIFCIHPESEFKSSYKVGGTKKLQLDKIRALQPDLIIGNKEENTKEQIEEISDEFPVWMSEINSVDDALDFITRIGSILGKSNECINLKLMIQSGLNRLIAPTYKLSYIYLIWKDPYFAVASGTYINSVLDRGGFINALANKTRYPEITIEQINQLQPDCVMLPSEPFPFKQEHVEALQKEVPKSHVVPVDGEILSWYGSKMLEAPDYLMKINSDIHKHANRS